MTDTASRLGGVLSSSADGAIPEALLEEAAYEAHRLAATTLPDDVKQAFVRMHDREAEELPKQVLGAIVENFRVAQQDQRPVCADVGGPRVYAVIGNETGLAGGLVALERAVRRATERVTRDLALRSNRCHPITRRNPGNNVGVFAPNIEYRVEPDRRSGRCPNRRFRRCLPIRRRRRRRHRCRRD